MWPQNKEMKRKRTFLTCFSVIGTLTTSHMRLFREPSKSHLDNVKTSQHWLKLNTYANQGPPGDDSS